MGTDVVLLYLNNTNGNLENCLWHSRPYGAMEKRVIVIDSIRSWHKNVLILDAGDLFNRRPQRRRHENIVRAYKIMQYDGIALGERDFVEVPEFLMTQLFALGNILIPIFIIGT